jgi:hypothetical protein
VTYGRFSCALFLGGLGPAGLCRGKLRGLPRSLQRPGLLQRDARVVR